jgi:DNA polymerase-3 subunit delta'
MDAILGQDRAVGQLQQALKSGRLHHAWIFSGPKGVGKFTTAVEFARILLDPNAGVNLAGLIQADPAGEASQMIDAGTHPDLHVIRKELALHSDNPQLRNRKLTNIPIDLLRERVIGGRTNDDRLHEGPAYRTAVRGGNKVFIIDEAELIDAGGLKVGQNALLKTLEEPPSGTYLVLVTSRPAALLPTVRSRCQSVAFDRLDDGAMSAWLDRAHDDLDDMHRRWLLQFADGAPGMAERAIEHDMFSWMGRLDPMLKMLERGAFPVDMGAVLAELVDGYAAAWVGRNENASKDVANKDGVGLVLSLLSSHARTKLKAATGEGNSDAGARWAQVIERLRDAEREIYANVNMKQVMEDLAAQWAGV